MKKFLIAALLLSSLNSTAQITLDNIVDSLDFAYWFRPVQISDTETKYFIEDTVTNTFSLYNMDFTQFMTNISVPEPFAQATSSFQALYITRALFDCDTSNIEYAYYSPGNVNKPFRIARTDGTILFQLDSANGPYCYGNCLGGTDMIRPIRNTSAGAKLFLQTYSLGYSQMYVYSLCGALPEDVFEFTNLSQSYVKVFPNPTSGSLIFQVNPPDNMNEYELIILDNSAREISRQKINFLNDKYSIDVKNFSSGTYFYSLSTKNKSYQSGKFILTK